MEGDEYDAVYWHKQPKFLDYVGVAADEKIVAGIDERLATAARKLEEAADAVIKKAE